MKKIFAMMLAVVMVMSMLLTTVAFAATNGTVNESTSFRVSTGSKTAKITFKQTKGKYEYHKVTLLTGPLGKDITKSAYAKFKITAVPVSGSSTKTVTKTLSGSSASISLAKNTTYQITVKHVKTTTENEISFRGWTTKPTWKVSKYTNSTIAW